MSWVGVNPHVERTCSC